MIGVHKWFARRPGSLLRALLLCEFGGEGTLPERFFRGHGVKDVTIADPFMGGGTTLFEANRIGCNTLGVDVNPMSSWVVRQELTPLDRAAFQRAAERVIESTEAEVAELYRTRCEHCHRDATAKYFLHVKQSACEPCGEDVDLFPGYLVAKNDRHTHFVLHCPGCRQIFERETLPARGRRVSCPRCRHIFVWDRGNAKSRRHVCPCGEESRHPGVEPGEPPRHRLFAIEYHCAHCAPILRGRRFKSPDPNDLERARRAARLLAGAELPAPEVPIPLGDETRRLHRWGYTSFRELFCPRQLYALGTLLERIDATADSETRAALATVFSDFARYQNMLCRYDTYALKCQDIFSLHGFPVGLIQCENNVLGIPGVGSGGFRHFVAKYDRAKAYCEKPFETRLDPGRPRRRCAIDGEQIAARPVARPEALRGAKRSFLAVGSLEDLALAPESLDGVFTDPPYFDNVQYAELIDYCFSWLRILLGARVPGFSRRDTRSPRELTGNATAGRGLEHFTEGLSKVFSAGARALKAGAPFVFTYHHNDPRAYAPVAVALLDAGLSCTATLPVPAEMKASLHINGTASGIVDSIFVCRRVRVGPSRSPTLRCALREDKHALAEAGLRCHAGDLLCLAYGHLTRELVQSLRPAWHARRSIADKVAEVGNRLTASISRRRVARCVADLMEEAA